jgi:hypothetical protein
MQRIQKLYSKNVSWKSSNYSSPKNVALTDIDDQNVLKMSKVRNTSAISAI